MGLPKYERPEATFTEIRTRSEDVLTSAGLRLLGKKAIYEMDVRSEEDRVAAYYFVSPGVVTDYVRGGGWTYGVSINQSISNDDWMKVGVRLFDTGVLRSVWAGERTEGDEDRAQIMSYHHRFLDLRSLPWGSQALLHDLLVRTGLDGLDTTSRE